MRKKQDDQQRPKNAKAEEDFEIGEAVSADDESSVESMGVEPLTPEEAAAMGAKPAAPPPQEADSGQVEQLKQQVAKLSNDYLYLRAEYDNYRRQSIKERSDMLKYGGERLAKDLLDTLDIFDTAMAAEITAENFADFVKGIQLTAQQLRSALQKHGITEIPSQGEQFNPVHHEALGAEPTDEMPPGHISKIFKKAYKYHDKVLRPGQVIIAKEKPQ